MPISRRRPTLRSIAAAVAVAIGTVGAAPAFATDVTSADGTLVINDAGTTNDIIQVRRIADETVPAAPLRSGYTQQVILITAATPLDTPTPYPFPEAVTEQIPLLPGAGCKRVPVPSSDHQVKCDSGAPNAKNQTPGNPNASEFKTITATLAAGKDYFFPDSRTLPLPPSSLSGGADSDVLLGTNNNDTLDGGIGDDDVRGALGHDTLTGGPGISSTSTDQDRLVGGQGTDVVLYANRADDLRLTLDANATGATIDGATPDGRPNDGSGCTAAATQPSTCEGDRIVPDVENVVGGTGNDFIQGTSGAFGAPVVVNNVLSGGAGSDRIFGLAGDDTLNGGEGNNEIFGAAGNDKFTAGAGDDVIDLGEGDDGGLGAGEGNAGDGANRITAGFGIDRVVSGSGADIVFGNEGDDTVQAGNGNNVVAGGEGIDTIVTGTGNDTLDGDGGDDTIVSGDGTNVIQGGAGGDTITGGAGADTAYGSLKDPAVGIVDLSDTIKLGGGDDFMQGFEGGDVLQGDVGSDTVSYEEKLDPVYAAATTGQGSAGTYCDPDGGVQPQGCEGDTITAVENLIGGRDNDKLIGDAQVNKFEGRAGNDLLVGSSANDTLLGDAGDDDLQGGLGGDLMKGHDGIDRVSYRERTTPVAVTMGDNIANDGEAAEGDNVGNDIENLEGGQAGDSLTGASGPNQIFGNDGNDKIDGADGADGIFGNAGVDTASYESRSLPVNVTLDGVSDDGENLERDNVSPTTENVIGGSGNDTLVGSDAIANTEPSLDVSGINKLEGRAGNDSLDGKRAGDSLIGNEGADTVRYSGRPAGERVKATLDGRRDANDGTSVIDSEGVESFVEGDTIDVTVENLAGGDEIDVFEGSPEANVLNGGGGDDVLDGLQSEDKLFGGSGADALAGGAGNDLLLGGLGPDYMNGDGGLDTFDYSDRAAGTAVDVSFDDEPNDGEAGEGDNASDVLGSRVIFP